VAVGAEGWDEGVIARQVAFDRQNGGEWNEKAQTFGTLIGRGPSTPDLFPDPTESNPAFPAGHPFSNVQSSQGYWLATSFASNTSGAWAVGLSVGNVGPGDKAITRFVWCVRGGHGGPDAQ
jgi:hypothetical protein